MNLRSPIVALVWENWRLSRVEAAQRLVLGLVGAAVALVVGHPGTSAAFWILIAVHGYFYFSIAKLNGGRFSDGYKPGFPLHLQYTRPVPTAAFVGAAMVYDAVSCTASYLVSAAFLGFVFGQPLPVFSIAVILLTNHLVCTCIQWSTRNRIVQWAGSIALGTPLFFLLFNRATSPLKVEFSLTENAVMLLVCVLSIGVAIAGIARQRRGDAVASAPREANSSGYPVWLVRLFRLRCPTSSATRAQIWYELKSGGIPVLTIGAGVALLIALLFALGVLIAPLRPVAVGVSIFGSAIALFTFGSNAFGIRRKQGRTYANAFEATQPYGTAHIAGLKVLVRSACVLLALTAIGMSIWAASSFMGAWGEWLADGKNDALPGLLKLRHTLSEVLAGQPAFAQAAKALLACVVVAGIVAWQSSREALRARYPRLMLVVTALVVLWGLTFVLTGLAVRNGILSALQARTIILTAMWISGAAVMFATIYLTWAGFAQRVLTVRYACGAFVISAIFVATWLAGISTSNVFGVLWLALPLLLASVVAPWSLDRARHA